jgi:hypothetical protein
LALILLTSDLLLLLLSSFLVHNNITNLSNPKLGFATMYVIFRAFLPLAHVVQFVICCNGPHHLDLPPSTSLQNISARTKRLAFPPLPTVALNYSIITVTTAAVI